MTLLDEKNMNTLEQLIRENEGLQETIREQEQTISNLSSEQQRLADSLQEQIGLVEKQNRALEHQEPTKLEAENMELKKALKQSEQVMMIAEQKARTVDERVEAARLEYAMELAVQQAEDSKQWEKTMEKITAYYNTELERQRMGYERIIGQLRTRLNSPWYMKLLYGWKESKHEKNY